MTPLNTIIEEEKEAFDQKFCNERICKGCLNKECDHSTTGCPWYQSDVFLGTDNATQVKNFLTTAMQRVAKTERANWLRSEIEKLEGDKQPNQSVSEYYSGYNTALTSIITRYKEELKVLESE